MFGIDPSLLSPFICFFGLLAVGYFVGIAGWIWLPVLFCAGLILAIIVLIAAWSVMPSGMDRVIYLAIAVFYLLPMLFGGTIGFYLGRRKRRKLSEAVGVPSP